MAVILKKIADVFPVTQKLKVNFGALQDLTSWTIVESAGDRVTTIANLATIKGNGSLLQNGIHKSFTKFVVGDVIAWEFKTSDVSLTSTLTNLAPATGLTFSNGETIGTQVLISVMQGHTGGTGVRPNIALVSDTFYEMRLYFMPMGGRFTIKGGAFATETAAFCSGACFSSNWRTQANYSLSFSHTAATGTTEIKNVKVGTVEAAAAAAGGDWFFLGSG